MPIAFVCALSLVLAWGALVALAIHQEYLVVLHWPRVALMVLERQEDRRYHQIHPALAPIAAARHAAHVVSLAPAALRRAATRVGERIPSLVSSKA